MTASRRDLEDEIEQTREHLAETVDALTDKLDVKSRAKETVQDPDNRRMATLVAAAVMAVAGLVLLRRSR